MPERTVGWKCVETAWQRYKKKKNRHTFRWQILKNDDPYSLFPRLGDEESSSHHSALALYSRVNITMVTFLHRIIRERGKLWGFVILIVSPVFSTG